MKYSVCRGYSRESTQRHAPVQTVALLGPGCQWCRGQALMRSLQHQGLPEEADIPRAPRSRRVARQRTEAHRVPSLLPELTSRVDNFSGLHNLNMIGHRGISSG